MVQVDVFWSYAIGAGFAVAAHRQLAAKPRAATFLGGLTDEPSFTQLALFLGLVFVPSGSWLLWGFTSWETMHAARDLPAWLVALFCATNVSQGVLGYAAARWFIVRGRPHAAFLQFVAGYFLMFLVLVHGWDGTGYQRFFSASPTELDGWTWSTAHAWLGSEVALTLDGMGVVLLPIMFALMLGPLRAGTPQPRAATTLVLAILGTALVGCLGFAIATSLLMRALGPWLGAGAAALLLGGLGIGRRGVFGPFRRAIMSR
jgi:hypothetical protein